jgi:hypothetical protein
MENGGARVFIARDRRDAFPHRKSRNKSETLYAKLWRRATDLNSGRAPLKIHFASYGLLPNVQFNKRFVAEQKLHQHGNIARARARARSHAT